MKARKLLSTTVAMALSLSALTTGYVKAAGQSVKEWHYNTAVEAFSNINANGTYSWSNEFDHTQNGGGSVKYEYKANGMSVNKGSLGYINIHQWDFIEPGNIYKISAQIYGSTVKSGAAVSISPNNTNKDAGVCDAVEIVEGQWTEVSGYLVGGSPDWLAFQFTGGNFSNNKDAESGFDVYYIDDVIVEKLIDTQEKNAALAKLSPNFDMTKQIIGKTAVLDFSKTKTIIEEGTETDVKGYLINSDSAEVWADVSSQIIDNSEFEAVSADENIAVYNNSTGKIEAKMPGVTVITFTHSGVSQPVTVTVYPRGNSYYNCMESPSKIAIETDDPVVNGENAYILYSKITNRIGTNIQGRKPSVVSFSFFVPGTTGSVPSELIGVYGGGYTLQMQNGGGNQRIIFPNSVDVSKKLVAGWNRVDFITGFPEKKSYDDGYMNQTWYLNGQLMDNNEAKINDGIIAIMGFNKLMVTDMVAADLSAEIKVDSITPDLTADNRNIDVGSKFVLNLSYPIDEETVDGNISLTDTDNAQNIPCLYEISGKMLTIQPKSKLLKNTNYTLTISKDIKSTLKTAAMSNNVVYNFKTQTNAVTISNVTAAGNSVAFDAANNMTEKVYIVAAAFNDKRALKPVYAEVDPGNVSGKTLTFADAANIDDYRVELFAIDKTEGEDIDVLSDIIGVGQSDKARTAAAEPVNKKLETMFDASTETVTLTYQSVSGFKGVPMIVRVYKKNTDKTFDNLMRIETVQSGADGSVGYTFKPGAMMDKGRYCVILTSPYDGGKDSSEFNCVTTTDVENAIYAIDASANEINPNNANSIDNVFAAIRDTLDFTDAEFDALNNKNFVYNCLISEKPYNKDLTKLRDVYKQALKMSVLLEGDMDTLTQEIRNNHANQYWGIQENSAYTAFISTLNAAQKKEVAAKLLSATKFGDLNDLFIMGVVIEDIKAQTSNTTIFAAVSKYNDLINIDFTVYSSLGESYKLQTCTNFYNYVKTNTPNGLAVLKTQFETFANEQKQAQNNAGTGTGGNTSGSTGGGGGGGKGGLVINPGNSTTDKPAPDWYQQDNDVAEQQSIFTDLDSVEWAKAYINKLYSMGVITGKGEGIFAPNDNLTREELCRMVALAFEFDRNDGEQTLPFTDISPDAWYNDAVTVCWQNGIIKGISDDVFGVGKTVTREEISTILVRAADAAGKSLDRDITIFPFNDDADISSWAKESVSILRECMIVSGVGDEMFAPQSNVTRAQASKMIVGVLDYKY